MVDHLHLKRCGSQVLSIITFGEEAGHQLWCDVVKVGLKKKEQSIQELTLLSVPSICGALKGIPRSELETKYPQLTKLDLVDQMDVDGTVSVLLIGMDYYWNFITEETLQCADCPVATRTSLGWVISGPVVTRTILDILLWFRSFQTALVADIEKAFLMMGIDRKDQDVLQFLWLKDWTQEPAEVQVLRFTRVVFGVASSPFLLNGTIRHHLEGYRASLSCLVDLLVESIYVDDVVYGAHSPEEAFDFYENSKSILQEGGFNLRKFVTNDLALQGMIDEAGNDHEMRESRLETETYTKIILGGFQGLLQEM